MMAWSLILHQSDKFSEKIAKYLLVFRKKYFKLSIFRKMH